MNKARRLFVGIPLSPSLKKRLGREMKSWPKDAILHTAEDNLHVTLVFLGFVQEDALPEVCAAIESVCQKTEAFELLFHAMQLVGDETSPRMIWLTGEASDALRILVEALEKAFTAFITERKTYRPHITLGKIKKAKWMKLVEKPHFKTSYALVEPVESIVLFESLSIDGKRRYIEIDTFPLR